MIAGSQHSNDTVFDTPTPESDDATDSDDFAILVPSNTDARKAFSEVVEQLLENQAAGNITEDTANLAHSRLVHFEEDVDNSGTSTELSDASVGQGAESSSDVRRAWRGYYRFSLSKLPENLGIGWLAGRQQHTNWPDFPLATTQKYDISSRHGRFHFNLDTGRLLLSSTKRTIVFGNDLIKGQTVVVSRSSRISMGRASYDLRFTEYERTEQYQAQLRAALQKISGKSSLTLLHNISSASSSHDLVVKGYTIQSAVARGTEGAIMPAIKDKGDGRMLAVKRCDVKKKDSGQRVEWNEVEVLKELQLKFGRHERIIYLVEEIELTNSGSKVDDRLAIFEPFLLTTLSEVIRGVDDPVGSEHKDLICLQALEGLAWLHEKGIMHRDLKPDNIGIKSFDSIQVVILDFGHATFNKLSMNHMRGTISYLAPEVLDLKVQASSQPYDCAVDVFALGMVLAQVALNKIARRIVNHSERTRAWNDRGYIHGLKGSLGRLSTPTSKLCLQMLEVDPRARISSRAALDLAEREFQSIVRVKGKHQLDENPLT